MSKLKVSLTFDETDAALVAKACKVTTMDTWGDLSRRRAWLMKLAIKAVCRALIKDGTGVLVLPFAVTIRTETPEEQSKRVSEKNRYDRKGRPGDIISGNF